MKMNCFIISVIELVILFPFYSHTPLTIPYPDMSNLVLLPTSKFLVFDRKLTVPVVYVKSKTFYFNYR